ncbi:hypothetical protein OROMI_008389 [Orobanche minor]
MHCCYYTNNDCCFAIRFVTSAYLSSTMSHLHTSHATEQSPDSAHASCSYVLHSARQVPQIKRHDAALYMHQ